MLSQYRTDFPMVDLFFNSFATMIEMQRAFVLGGMKIAGASSKSTAPIQPPGEIARATSMRQEVQTARDTGGRVKDQKKAQVRRSGRRAAASEKSRRPAVFQNSGKRKNRPNPSRDMKRRGIGKR